MSYRVTVDVFVSEADVERVMLDDAEATAMVEEYDRARAMEYAATVLVARALDAADLSDSVSVSVENLGGE